MATLYSKIFLHKQNIQQIAQYLNDHPQEWGRYQVQFNDEVNSIFKELVNFEKQCTENKQFNQVNRLKKMFVGKIRKPFERGQYIDWVIRKPYGYAGDFKYIEDIYQNQPQTLGYDRLFDNYTMMSPISIAVRNRKNDFKKMIIEQVENSKKKTFKVMSLACGPSREIREIKIERPDLFKRIEFHCYDIDQAALDFSESELKGCENVQFFNDNVVKIALSKDVSKRVKYQYDLVYSTGLFDYLEEKIARRLITNLRKVLVTGGVMMISDVRDKYSNPSFHFMEWIGDWPLVYRSDEAYRKLFTDSGFLENQLKIGYEQQGILQYMTASK